MAASTRPAVHRRPARPTGGPEPTAAAKRCRRKFLRIFPGGFRDETYVEWERDYKWDAHTAWAEVLSERRFRALLDAGDYAAIAGHAVRIESRTNLIFSFEKMALRDALREPAGIQAFAEGLFAFLHGPGELEERFTHWVDVVGGLPRKQTRVLTWPIVTVFGFIADPKTHNYLKPNVTKQAAKAYGFDFRYASRPNWETYANYLAFAARVRRDLRDLRPRDMIDLQSFIWIQGSDEYEE